MSYIIRDKDTKQAIMEVSKDLADHVNEARYEAVPVLQHLQELNIKGSRARLAATNITN